MYLVGCLAQTQCKVAVCKGSQTQELTQTQKGRQTPKYISMQQNSMPRIVAVFVRPKTAPTSINKAMFLQTHLAAVVCSNSKHNSSAFNINISIRPALERLLC